MTTMAPDTQTEVFKINTKMFSSILSVLLAFVAGIAWGVRLEYKTEENDRTNVRQDVSIEQLKAERADFRERFVRLESDTKHLVTGMEEIKVLLKKQLPSQ